MWALSLAHSQLTDVFFDKVLGLCLATVKEESMSPKVGGAVMFVGFAIWLAVTFAVLMVMESLSAVLHALRLHWVEFQNKYYKGDGTHPAVLPSISAFWPRWISVSVSAHGVAFAGVKFAPFSFTEENSE